MSKRKICVKCESKNIISDEYMLPHCDDCGFIINQKKAQKQFQEEMKNGYY